MKLKAIIAITLTGLFLLILWLGTVGLAGLRDEASESLIVLKIEKYHPVIAVNLPLVQPAASIPAEHNGNEPLLFVLLIIFIAVSAGGVGIVCHLLRSGEPAG